jgi:hypothetical protein
VDGDKVMIVCRVSGRDDRYAVSLDADHSAVNSLRADDRVTA